MIDSQIHAVAKFFYLTSKNPPKTNEAIRKTLAKLKSLYQKNPKLEDDASVLVYWTNKYWKQVFKNRQLAFIYQANREPGSPTASYFTIPKDTDLNTWNEFMSKSSEDELMLVVWSKILQIDENQIAKGLGISFGTVRFRVAAGLRKLSEVMDQHGKA